MAIKIDKDPSGILPQVANRAQAPGAGGSQKSVPNAGDSTSSAVNLTRFTESLQQGLRSSAPELSFDKQRVAEIRDAIATGRYEVDFEATAQAIVSLETDIFG